MLHLMTSKEYEKTLKNIPGLHDLIKQYAAGENPPTQIFLMEFALHGLAEYSMLSKQSLTEGIQFKDLMSSMFSLPEEDELNEGEARSGLN